MLLSRRQIIASAGSATLLGCAPMQLGAPPIEGRRFEGAQISAGANRPGLPMRDGYDTLLAHLFLRIPAEQSARLLGLTAAQRDERIAALVQERLARRLANGEVRPTALVASDREVSRYLRVHPGVVRATADAVEAALPEVRRRYDELPGFAHLPFEDASLLILSNVLLDNWQIDRVEAEFLRAERPLRGGGRYYYSVLEVRPNTSVERYGIYGNHSESVGPATISLYGNQRYAGPTNLVTLSRNDFVQLFGFPEGTEVSEAQAVLAGDLLRRWRDPTAATPEARENGLRALRLIDGAGRVAIPILAAEDERGLNEMAAAFAPTLLSILEGHRAELMRQYRASPYAADGVSFLEYTIWWYHFYYTAATDLLAERGHIRMPPASTMTYLFMG